jgi:cytoskeletal protein CcmA (bactofilin family)
MAVEDLESGSNALEQPETVMASKPADSSVARRRPPIILVVLALLVILASGIGLTIVIHHTRAPATIKTITINTQSLDSGTLHTLTTQLAKTGQVQQQLTISPNTLFKNNVTVQGAGTIDGDLTVKGSTNLLGPVATGNNLAVGNGLTVGHNASIGGSLSVAGIITAGSLNVGSINLTTLSLSGNFSWAGHLIANGTVPTVSSGPTIGNGTATVTGNDSLGTVVITAGTSGLLNEGELATIHFHTAYTGTPLVQLTPTDQGAAALQYYVVAAPGFFAIRTVSAPTTTTPYTFTYFVAQ